MKNRFTTPVNQPDTGSSSVDVVQKWIKAFFLSSSFEITRTSQIDKLKTQRNHFYIDQSQHQTSHKLSSDITLKVHVDNSSVPRNITLIPSYQLALGMHVVELEQRWIQVPVSSHSDLSQRKLQ